MYWKNTKEKIKTLRGEVQWKKKSKKNFCYFNLEINSLVRKTFRYAKQDKDQEKVNTRMIIYFL